MMQKLQIAMEFMLVFLFVTTIFIFFFSLISSRASSLFGENAYTQTQQLAQQIAHNINTAYNGGSGYVSNTILESGFGLNNFNISILRNGEVIITANQIDQKIRTIAFSQARNLYMANTLPANYITTQNFFGLICVDISCPETGNYPSSITLSTEGTSVAKFNGVNSRIVAGSTNLPIGSSPRSLSAWVYLSGNGIGSSSYGSVIQEYGYPFSTSGLSELYVYHGTLGFSAGGESFISSLKVPIGRWSFVGYGYQSGSTSITLYLNGNGQTGSLSGGAALSTPSGTSSEIGAEGNTINSGYFNGSISNIQLYDTFLNSNQVLQLFGQGIMGSGVSTQNMVGWWKLAGNAEDYSGDNNTGTIYGQLIFPTVSESTVKVLGQYGNPIANSITGFSSTLGSIDNLSFSSNYTNASGIAYEIFNQNLTNGPSTINVTTYPGNSKEEKNLTGWWPLVNGMAKTTVIKTSYFSDAIQSAKSSHPGVTLPPNIEYYVPVTITNYPLNKVKPNSQIAVTINALNYQNYYTCNLNNAEFFYANTGAVVPSWLEGNYTNETNANAMCTSASSKGALVDSGTILYWINIGNSAADGNLGDIYMGWAGNTLSPSNTLMNGVTTGEAPELTCPNPAVTANCPTYAEYDNGNSIFNFYSNFAGTTLPSDWKDVNGVGYTVDNGIQITSLSNSYSYINATTQAFTQGTVMDALTTFSPSWDADYEFGGIGTGGITSANVLMIYGNDQGTGSLSPEFYTSVGGGDLIITNYLYPPTANAPQLLTMVYNASVPFAGPYDTWVMENYTDPFSNTYIFPSGFPLFPAVAGAYYGASPISYQNTTWVRVRNNPPNGVMPTVRVGGVNYLLSTNTIFYNLGVNGGNEGFGINITFPYSLAEIPGAGFAPASFNGNTEEVNVIISSPTSSLYMNPESTGMSIFLWFAPNESESALTSNSATLIGTSGTSCGYKLWFSGANSIEASDNCGNGVPLQYAFNSGAWYNLAITINNTYYERYYIDGIYAGGGQSTKWLSSNTWNKLCIASDCGSAYFKGSIFNLQLYNTTLNTTDIYQLYASGFKQENTTTSFTLQN